MKNNLGIMMTRGWLPLDNPRTLALQRATYVAPVIVKFDE